jgi:hypothetical protein
MNQQQNAISLARVKASSLVGKSLVWNVVKHRLGCWMKLAGLLSVLFTIIGCKNESRVAEKNNDSNRIYDSILIPFHYFPLGKFTSSDSPEAKNVFENIRSRWNDTGLKLPEQEIAKLIDPLFDLSGVDKEYLKKHQSYYPISAWIDSNGTQSYIVAISGDDLFELIYFKKDAKTILAIRVKGGVCGGPILENETVIVPCESEIVEFNLAGQIVIRKKFIASSKLSNEDAYSDSGMIVLNINGISVDTVSKSGIITADQFFNLHDLHWAADSILYPN